MHDAIGIASARGVFRTLPAGVNAAAGSLDVIEVRELLSHLETSGRLFALPERGGPAELLREAITRVAPAKQKAPRFTVSVDRDVLVVHRATQAFINTFFSATDGMRLTAAVSALTGNVSMYAKQGHVTLRPTQAPHHWRFDVEAVDTGPGIPHLELALSGSSASSTGPGRGRIGSRALLDDLHLESAAGLGTRITGHRSARKTCAV